MDKFLGIVELVLRLIEVSDVRTIWTLEKYFKELICTYKKSIIAEKRRAYHPVLKGAAKSHLVFEFFLPEGGSPHHDPDQSWPDSTSTFRRSIIPAHSWRSIWVLERREEEIEILLNAPYLRIRPGPGPASQDFEWPRLQPPAKLKLRRMLKRATYLTDILRDMEALAVVSLGLPCFLWKSTYPDGQISDPRTAPSGVLDRLARGSTALQRVLKSEIVPVQTRRLQVRFIRGLPTEDLVGLYALCRITVESWHESHMLPAHTFGNAGGSLFEKELSFKETLLRYGSWFLYGEVRGYAGRAAHKKKLLEDVYSETVRQPSRPIDWEHTLVGTMHEQLMWRLAVDIRRLESKALKEVEKMIGAREPAFDNPASRLGHGAAAVAAAAAQGQV